MKTPQPSILDPQPRDAEADVAMQIGRLFGYYPELAGFVVEDLRESAGDGDPSDEASAIVITEVGFRTPVSQDEYNRVWRLIDQVVSNLVSTWPEAFDLVRGRTFARTLH
jgi:hypothetical protein